MSRNPVEPTTDEHGIETHPAFGMISAARVTSTPRQVLFQSDVRHTNTIRIRVNRADRRRDLSHDWLHDGPQLIEVELSETQWASFVSSMNTSGVPATIRATETDRDVPDLPYEPRLAESMAEVRNKASLLFKEATEALTEYEAALEAKAGAAVRRAALRKLHYALHNSGNNVTFVAENLAEHAENVVQRARSDIEAMVAQEALRLQLDPSQAPLLELPSFDPESAS